MKKTIKALSLLGAVGALAACNGGTAYRDCSFNEFAHSIYADYTTLMETARFRHDGYHSEKETKHVETEDGLSFETVVTSVCDVSFTDYIIVINTETVSKEPGKEPKSEKVMTTYFYDAERGVICAEDNGETKEYFIAISNENIQKTVNEKDSGCETVDDYLKASFGEAYYGINSDALTVDGYTQMFMQYNETMMITEIPGYPGNTTIKTDGSHYFFDSEMSGELEDTSSTKENSVSDSFHFELDGMIPVYAYACDIQTGKLIDDDDPTKLYDYETFTETTVSFEMEFKGSIPDITDFKLVIPE